MSPKADLWSNKKIFTKQKNIFNGYSNSKLDSTQNVLRTWYTFFGGYEFFYATNNSSWQWKPGEHEHHDSLLRAPRQSWCVGVKLVHVFGPTMPLGFLVPKLLIHWYSLPSSSGRPTKSCWCWVAQFGAVCKPKPKSKRFRMLYRGYSRCQLFLPIHLPISCKPFTLSLNIPAFHITIRKAE